MLCGSLCILYFIGIIFYAGLSSLFPFFWAITGGFLFVLAEIAGRPVPVWIRYGFGTAVSLFLILFFVVETFIFSGMYHEPSRDLDYIIVLGAQVNGSTLSNSLRRRVDRAKEYLDKNLYTKVIVSGGKGAGEDISEAEAMYLYLISQDISGSRIIKEDRSRNTSQNLKYSFALIDQKEEGRGTEKSVGIVTNNFHVFRGVSLGKKLGCEKIEGIPAKSNAFLQVNFLVREFFSVIKDKLVGNM